MYKIQLTPNLMKSYKSGLRDNWGTEGLVSAVSTHKLHDEGSLKMIQDYFKQRNTSIVINIVYKIQLKPNLMKTYKSGLRDNGGNEGRVSEVSTHDLHDEGSLERNTILMFTCIQKPHQNFPTVLLIPNIPNLV